MNIVGHELRHVQLCLFSEYSYHSTTHPRHYMHTPYADSDEVRDSILTMIRSRLHLISLLVPHKQADSSVYVSKHSVHASKVYLSHAFSPHVTSCSHTLFGGLSTLIDRW